MSRKEPKVLLVYPPNQLMDIEIPRPDGSLGLLYLAGALRAAGIEVEVLDASVGPVGAYLQDTFFRRVRQPNGLIRIGMTPEQISSHVARGGYDLVCITSIFTPQTRMAVETAQAVKAVNPQIPVIAGGGNAHALADRLLATNAIDLVAVTESEGIIVPIVRAWQNNAGWGDLDAVMYRQDGQLVNKPVKPDTIQPNLDELALPAWDLLPFEHYQAIDSRRANTTPEARQRWGSMQTSRGCPFQCLYCHISGEMGQDSPRGDLRSLRFSSVDRVMQEMEMLRSLGVGHLYFEDDSLLAKKPRVTNIFRRAASLGMKISDINGVNLAHFARPVPGGGLEPDVEYLHLMRQAGFEEIVYPVESGSQRVLDTYASGKLKLSRFDVTRLMRVASREVGIKCLVNIMLGFPDETEEEMMQSVALAERLMEAGATYVTFFIPIPFPGSRLFTLAIERGYLSPDFDPDQMNWKNAVMRNTTVPPERITAIRDWAWDKVNTPEYKQSRVEREMRSLALLTE